ncbi:hypothetical protein B296_00019426, partial [Ensete ventricosum]
PIADNTCQLRPPAATGRYLLLFPSASTIAKPFFCLFFPLSQPSPPLSHLLLLPTSPLHPLACHYYFPLSQTSPSPTASRFLLGHALLYHHCPFFLSSPPLATATTHCCRPLLLLPHWCIAMMPRLVLPHRTRALALIVIALSFFPSMHSSTTSISYYRSAPTPQSLLPPPPSATCSPTPSRHSPILYRA